MNYLLVSASLSPKPLSPKPFPRQRPKPFSRSEPKPYALCSLLYVLIKHNTPRAVLKNNPWCEKRPASGN